MHFGLVTLLFLVLILGRSYANVLFLFHYSHRSCKERRLKNRYCPQNVCKLQSSYICGEIANQTKNNEAYSGTKIGNYFRNGLK